MLGRITGLNPCIFELCKLYVLLFLASLAAQTVVYLQYRRPRFDPWVRKIP